MEFVWNLFHQIYDVEFLVRAGGLLALTVIVFVETGLLIGFFLPGDSLLVTAGIFAAKGDLDLVMLNLVLSAAAIAGDTVGIARFIPIIRTFAPVVAGVGVMPYKRFLLFNVFGGIFWVMSTTLAGYFLGTLIPNIEERIHVI